MKYFVVDFVYDDKRETKVNKIIGCFERLFDAFLFRNAYNAHYNAKAEIYSCYKLLNE